MKINKSFLFLFSLPVLFITDLHAADVPSTMFVKKTSKNTCIVPEKAIGGLKLQRNQIQAKCNAKKADLIDLNDSQNKYVAGDLNYILSCIKVWKAEAILNFTVGNFDY